MKKIILFVSVSFVFLNISVAQAACTVNSGPYYDACTSHFTCTFIQSYGVAYGTENNPGNCRTACQSWGTSGHNPAHPSLGFKYYHYIRYSDSSVNCYAYFAKPSSGCSSAPSGTGGGSVEELKCNF